MPDNIAIQRALVDWFLDQVGDLNNPNPDPHNGGADPFGNWLPTTDQISQAVGFEISQDQLTDALADLAAAGVIERAGWSINQRTASKMCAYLIQTLETDIAKNQAARIDRLKKIEAGLLPCPVCRRQPTKTEVRQ